MDFLEPNTDVKMWKLFMISMLKHPEISLSNPYDKEIDDN